MVKRKSYKKTFKKKSSGKGNIKALVKKEVEQHFSEKVETLSLTKVIRFDGTTNNPSAYTDSMLFPFDLTPLLPSVTAGEKINLKKMLLRLSYKHSHAISEDYICRLRLIQVNASSKLVDDAQTGEGAQNRASWNGICMRHGEIWADDMDQEDRVLQRDIKVLWTKDINCRVKATPVMIYNDDINQLVNETKLTSKRDYCSEMIQYNKNIVIEMDSGDDRYLYPRDLSYVLLVQYGSRFRADEHEPTNVDLPEMPWLDGQLTFYYTDA